MTQPHDATENIFQQRQKDIKNAKRIVVKIGSAVLTGQNGLQTSVIAHLSDQLSALVKTGREFVLVSSGAVAAGRGLLAQVAPGQAIPHRQAASAIGQSRLMRVYDECLGHYGIVTAQVLVTRSDLEARDRYLNIRNTLRTLLDWGAIPIINENDTTGIHELVYGDNDCLSALLLNVVGADLLINLTSADGVFETNPDTDPNARCMTHITNIADIDIDTMCSGKTTVGTGGMYSKLLAARRAAQLSVPTLILSGKKRGALTRAFAGEPVGTWVIPDSKPISRRKFWLAYNMEPKGILILDDGAISALQNRGKSLLPIGITGIEGEFKEGDLVRLVDKDKNQIGVGLTNYDINMLNRIKRLHTDDIEKELGDIPYSEAVHRDNMLIDAAV